MHNLRELIDSFREGSMHLRRMAEKLDFPWSPILNDHRKLHNVYARSLITCYVAKFAQLTEAICESIDNDRYLIYALAGRSLIESTATLRYYTLFQYKPLLDKGLQTSADMKALIEIDDRHLRGSRFDWDAFFSKRYVQLIDDAVKTLRNKKKNQKYIAKGIIVEQVNILTCIEKWAEVTPEALIAYSLFCDLVHPNIGSSFLVSSTNDSGLYFTPAKGESVGAAIFEQTFPLLVSVTQKPFGEHLLMLMGTIWQEEEL